MESPQWVLHNPSKINDLQHFSEARHGSCMYQGENLAATSRYVWPADPGVPVSIKNTVVAITLIATAALCSTAQAAYVVTYGHTANGFRDVPLVKYDAALDARTDFFDGGMPAVQGFEDFATGTTGNLAITFGSGDNAVTATLGGTSGRVAAVTPGTTDEGRYSVAGSPGNSAAEGTKFWETKATNAGSTFELWFDNPVIKFGFFGVDVGDFGGVLELDLLGRDPVTGDEVLIGTVGPGAAGGAVISGPADGSVLYFGVTAQTSADWFRGVRFRSVIGGSRTTLSDDVFAFDSFTVVAAPRGPLPTPLPAPGTLALLGAAMVGLALLRRRA